MSGVAVLPEDIDHIPDVVLPRANEMLFGHEVAEGRFVDAFLEGRAPHAWLIGGAEGVGKATLAFRLARVVLAQGASASRVASLRHTVAQLAHPDLVLIRRAIDGKRNTVRSQIRVEDVRLAMQRMLTTSGAGGFRVAIIDTADDFNEHCGNALLKTIEEPPAGVFFFVLAHRPGRMQATLRSRCRRLMLAPLADDEMMRAIARLMPSADQGQVRLAVRHAHGSPGKALRLIAKGWLDLVVEMEELFGKLGSVSARELATFSERLEGRAKDDAFRLFRETLSGFVASEAAHMALGPHGLAAAARLAEEGQALDRRFETGSVFNLPRRNMIVSYLENLQRLRA